MKNLMILQLVDVLFSEIVLDETTTPNLEEVFLQNVPDECKMKILLPKLKFFSIHYYDAQVDYSWIHSMLACATKLEHFDSYKLRVDELKFASNNLNKIILRRAECLESLVIYGPKLRELSLQVRMLAKF